KRSLPTPRRRHQPHQRKASYDHRNHLSHCASSARGRRPADMAAQPELGLRPELRLGARPRCPPCFPPHPPGLKKYVMGHLFLAIFLIVFGLNIIFGLAVPVWVSGMLAVAAGILLLAERFRVHVDRK